MSKANLNNLDPIAAALPLDTIPTADDEVSVEYARNNPNYLQQFHLLIPPFAVEPDDNLYYPDPGQKQRLDLMLHLTQFGEEILLVSGEQGSGKSSLLQQFVKQAHSSWKMCVIKASPTIILGQLLRQISQCFDLRHEAQIIQEKIQELQGNLSDFLTVEPGPVVLLVDDAHLLSAECLSNVLELANIRDAGSKKQLRIVLLAEPGFKTKLLEPEVAPARFSKMRKLEIPALSRFHSDALLNYRLRAAGFTDKVASEKILARIYKDAEGNPGKLCQAMHEYLSEQVTPEKTASDTKSNISLGKIVFFTAVAAVIFGLLYFQDSINRVFEPAITAKKTRQPALAQTAPKSESEKLSPLNTHPAPTKPISDKKDIPPLALSEEELDSIIAGHNLDQADIISDSDMQSTPASEPSASAAAQSAPDKTPDLPAQPKSPEDKPAADKPAAAEQPAAAKSKPEPIKKRPAKPKKAPSKAKPTAPNNLVAALGHDSSWIKKQPAQNFTLQLIGGYQLGTLHRYIARHPQLDVSQLSYYLSYNKRGKAWHSLIYGSYSNLHSARKAASALEKSLKIKQPWIRRFSSIHRALK